MKKLLGITLGCLVTFFASTASCAGDESTEEGFVTLETEPSEGIVGEPWTYPPGGFSYAGWDHVYLVEDLPPALDPKVIFELDFWDPIYHSWYPPPFGFYDLEFTTIWPETEDWYNPPTITGTDLVVEDCDRHKHAKGAGHQKGNGIGHDCEKDKN